MRLTSSNFGIATFQSKMIQISTVLLIIVAVGALSAQNYMDDVMDKNKRKQEELLRISDSDPCRPLYWYPNAVPAYCDKSKQKRDAQPQPVPIPLPIPVPAPGPPPAPIPVPPLPYGIPIHPQGPMLPLGIQSYQPYPYPPPQFPYPYQQYPMPAPIPPLPSGSGIVPGLPGIVSPNGGINIMPFSDVYSDVIEKHKRRKMIKEMEKIWRKYGDKSWKNKYRQSEERPYDFS